MEYLSLIGSVTLIHLIAVMSPGPDFLIILKHSFTYDRRVAVWTAIGIGVGIMVHVMYSFVGLALIIKNSELIFNIIRYAGATYLLYLGISSILSKSSGSISKAEHRVEKKEMSSLKSFRIGFLTNVLNPKATLFFLSLFTLVIDQDTPLPIMFIISFIMVVNTALWFILLAYMITIEKVRRRFDEYERWLNLVFGLLLILVAVQIVFG